MSDETNLFEQVNAIITPLEALMGWDHQTANAAFARLDDEQKRQVDGILRGAAILVSRLSTWIEYRHPMLSSPGANKLAVLCVLMTLDPERMPPEVWGSLNEDLALLEFNRREVPSHIGNALQRQLDASINEDDATKSSG